MNIPKFKIQPMPTVACPSCENQDIESGSFAPTGNNLPDHPDDRRFNRYCPTCDVAFDWCAGIDLE